MSPVSPERLAAGRASVEQLFRAVGERDCPAAQGLLPRLASAEDCTELFHEWEEHGLELLEVLEVAADGRDHDSVIVRCRVRRSGSVSVMMVRATVAGDRWTVAL